MNDRLRTALTMTLLVGVLLGMGFFGWKATTAKFPTLGGPTKETCQLWKEKTKVKRGEIAVSVYNGSNRAGLAGDTQRRLLKLGFKPGNTGNAPDGTNVGTVVVWTTTEGDPTAQLVARQFKQKARVVVVEESYGPGPDVILGPKFKGVKRNPPKFQMLAEPKRTCLD